jgi:hypothetical protein
MKNINILRLSAALVGVLLLAISESSNSETPKKKIDLPAVSADGLEVVTVSVYPKRVGGKFNLDQDYQVKIAVRPEFDIQTGLISLDTEGNLLLRSGFSWNGANATIDTKTILRGAMVHDALYELMREGELSSSRWRETVDQELRRLCREDGMARVRAGFMYFGVRQFGEKSARTNPGNSEHNMLVALNDKQRTTRR